MYPKSFVGRAPPGPAGGAYSAPPDPLAGFKGPTSKEGEDRAGRGGRGEKGRPWDLSPTHNFWLHHCLGTGRG